MTDTERERINAICEVAGISEIDDLSDGFHTFRQLYYQRMMLFAVIVKQNHDRAWKSLRHEDGELCFGGGWFIVGIDTPEGGYTYHYENNYYSLFDCEELECGKHWDGHTEKDVTRLLSLQVVPDTNVGDTISRKGVFIPNITVEMFRNASLEGVEDLMASGEMEDISLPSAQPEQKWIPCSEKLPDVGQDVLFSVMDMYAAEGCLRDDGNWWQFRWDTVQLKDHVTAWMPLPEPYAEGREERL